MCVESSSRIFDRSFFVTLALTIFSAVCALAQTPPIQPRDAEMRWRQVGWMANLSIPCPQPGGVWPNPVQIDLMGERFCIFKFQGAGAVTPQQISVLASLPQLDELGPDRMALAAMGEIDDLLLEHQAALFQAQIGDVLLPQASIPANIQLALLDTQPDTFLIAAPDEERSYHGKTLRFFADHLLCKSQPCLVNSHSRLALPYLEANVEDPTLAPRDEVHGGLTGTIAELGEKLVEEIDGWPVVGAAGSRKVLNLSVAWDGNLFGGLEKDNIGAFDPLSMPVDVRLVFRALQEAADAGILVVAAAGNRSDHRQSPGPLLPAAWEQTPSPVPPAGSSSVYRPLLYAVAGVDSSGHALVNAQPQSSTPRVAYADHAVLASEIPGVATANLTGSSVSALVVSATAAAVWYYAPWLDAPEVMDVLYQSGDPLTGRAVDICFPSPEAAPCSTARPAVRRVSLCRAVETICSATETCPPPFDPISPSPCTPWEPGPAAIPAEDLAPFIPEGSSVFLDPALIPGASTFCELQSYFDPAAPLPVDPCPSWQYNGLGATPWVNPQPGSNPCPNCPIVDDRITIDIDPNFSGVLSSPSLVVCGMAFSLPVPDLGADGLMSYQVEGIPLPVCSSGTLTFTSVGVDGEISSTFSAVQISP